MLSDQAASIVKALQPGGSATLSELLDDPPSYKFHAHQRTTAATVNASLLQLADHLAAASPPLSDDAPNPRAESQGPSALRVGHISGAGRLRAWGGSGSA